MKILYKVNYCLILLPASIGRYINML
uniref:Uncharacterized protein n=1 Tax=Arundo donax TaxID=35708 RepID=A0A0A9FG96_ARUDO